MHHVGRWLDRGRAVVEPSSIDTVKEARNMEVALRAAELLMNDDIPGAEEQLSHGNSAFHKLATGTLGFMKATLGFEQDAMKEASDLLADAENSAYIFHQKSIQDPNHFTSDIYDKGAEFALCQAEAQIMTAVVAMLNESLTDSLRGFYKMRKAYMTLDGLAQMEVNYMKKRGVQSIQNSRNVSKESLKSARSDVHRDPSAPVTSSTLRTAMSAKDTGDDSDGSDEFFESEEIAPSNNVAKSYEGHMDHSSRTPMEEKSRYLQVSASEVPRSSYFTSSPLPSGATTPNLQSGAVTPALEVPPGTSRMLLTVDADSDIFTSSLDVFVHSGVNLMSGLINLMLSVIPPAFSRLLGIIGFRGDRERGLRMLWQASKFANINGGMAALILFGWYNGIIGFCDIITDSDPTIQDDINGFPMERLHGLLGVMRERYPKSTFWKLEEARTYSTTRRLSTALDILIHTEKANMKQLEALRMFEMSIDAMNAHRYGLCAESFLTCVELNAWSQALYYYTAAAAYLQLYRDLKDGSESVKAEKYKALAEKYFKDAPNYVGKKKMMGKQLPFDVFVVRKVAKWNKRAADWDCSFIDAIGVSPIDEIVMLWNGYKKMDETQLNKSLANLAWSEKNPYWSRESLNEQAILATLRAIVFRNLRNHEKARSILNEKVIPHDAAAFKGPLQDEWMGPVANYEMAANYWMERKEYIRRYGRTISGPEKDNEIVLTPDIKADAVVVAQARKYIDKAKNWGSYELDARIGMKITAGFAAIGRWETKHKNLVV